MKGYLYTLPDCKLCFVVKELLELKKWEWQEVPIDNPLVEFGIQVMFKDKRVHAPVYVVPNEGVWIFLPQGDDKVILARVISLKPESAGIMQSPEPVMFEQSN